MKTGDVVNAFHKIGRERIDIGIGIIIDCDIAPDELGLHKVRFVDGHEEWVFENRLEVIV